MKYDKMKKRFIKFFKRSCKDFQDFKVGAEFEHFIIKKETMEAVNYDDYNGIKKILEDMESKGWIGVFENKNIIGLKKNNKRITLEPGGQFEFSSSPAENIKNLECQYLEFLDDILPICENYGYLLICLGYQPESGINDISWVPKKRYRFMSKYLKNKGEYAHNMMKGTASLQVAIDYKSEKDFKRKMQAAYLLSFLLSSFFDNSPFFEGGIYDKRMLRTKIWENCDDDRCGVIPGVLSDDFGFEQYAEYILNTVPIITLDREGGIRYNIKSLYKLYSPEKWNFKQFYHTFSMVFPDVRAREFIEIRFVDALKYPLNIACVAFIKNIFYNKELLNYVLNDFSEIDEIKLNMLRNKMIKTPKLNFYDNKNIFKEIKKLYNKVVEKAHDHEKKYLKYLEYYIEKEITPRDYILNMLKNNGKKNVMKNISNNNRRINEKS